MARSGDESRFSQEHKGYEGTRRYLTAGGCALRRCAETFILTRAHKVVSMNLHVCEGWRLDTSAIRAVGAEPDHRVTNTDQENSCLCGLMGAVLRAGGNNRCLPCLPALR